MSKETNYIEVEPILRFERRDSVIEFPKPTESAKDVEDYYEFIRADESKEVAQAIFLELIERRKEINEFPFRLDYVDIRDVVRIFEKYGIKQVDKTTKK